MDSGVAGFIGSARVSPDANAHRGTDLHVLSASRFVSMTHQDLRPHGM